MKKLFNIFYFISIIIFLWTFTYDFDVFNNFFNFLLIYYFITLALTAYTIILMFKKKKQSIKMTDIIFMSLYYLSIIVIIIYFIMINDHAVVNNFPLLYSVSLFYISDFIYRIYTFITYKFK